MGAGSILQQWMKGAAQIDDMEVVAVASRTKETAEKQAAEWGIKAALSYEEMLADPEIDVCYIPVPHTAHKDLAMKAMKTGKNVLVEKPAAVCAADWKEMVQTAKENDVFLMEGYWTRFFPVIQIMLDEIAKGTIGDVRIVESSFCFRIDDDNRSRLVDPKRAGGALLDTGVYNLHFAEMVYNRPPQNLTGFASVGNDNLHLQVDEQSAWMAQYDYGEVAIMTSAIRTLTIDTAYVYGTKGYMVIPRFWRPTTIEIHVGDRAEIIEKKVPQKVSKFEDVGFQYELRHVNECLRKGVKESPLISWERTSEVLAQCDTLRKQWGLEFPGIPMNDAEVRR